MSIRKIKPYKSSDFIQKTIDIDRKISYIADLNDLAAHKDEFTKREYLSIYQSFAEVDIWDDASWEERKILSPIIDFFYDHNNCPVLIYPRFEPLDSEESIFRYDEDEIPIELQKKLSTKGMTDESIGVFLNSIINFCYKYDLNEEDIILNFSNIGWNKIFGTRIIDFGLTNKINKIFQEDYIDS